MPDMEQDAGNPCSLHRKECACLIAQLPSFTQANFGVGAQGHAFLLARPAVAKVPSAATLGPILDSIIARTQQQCGTTPTRIYGLKSREYRWISVDVAGMKTGP